MSLTEKSENLRPSDNLGVAAVLACFACCLYLFGIATPTVEWLNAWWAGWLVYAVIPIALTFTLFHASGIRRGSSEIVRDTLLLLLSGGVLLGVTALMLFIVVLVSVFTGIARIGP
jgi:RsiW-degrading membrane proteinase PrsW (M82 family)